MKKTRLRIIAILCSLVIVLSGCVFTDNNQNDNSLSGEANHATTEPDSAEESSAMSEEDESRQPVVPHGDTVDTDGKVHLSCVIEDNQSFSCRVFPFEESFVIFAFGDYENGAMRLYQLSEDGSDAVVLCELGKGAEINEDTVSLNQDGKVCFFDNLSRTYFIYDLKTGDCRTVQVPDIMVPYWMCFSSDYSTYWGLIDGVIYRCDIETGERRMLIEDPAFASQMPLKLFQKSNVLCLSSLDKRTGITYTVFANSDTGEILFVDDYTYLSAAESNGNGLYVRYKDSDNQFLSFESNGKVNKLSAPGLDFTYDYCAIPSEKLLVYSYSRNNESTSSKIALNAISLSDGSSVASTTFSDSFSDAYMVSATRAATNGNIICIPYLVYYPNDETETYDPISVNVLLWDILDNRKEDDCTSVALEISGGITDAFVAPEKNTILSGDIDRLRNEIAQKYGINIFLGTECEHYYNDYYSWEILQNEQKINDALISLDEALGKYPAGFINQLKYNHIREISFYFCGIIKGIGEYSISYAGAFASQYGNEQSFVIDISGSSDIRQTVCHELSHAIDCKLAQTQESGFSEEDWSKLNPEGFTYTFSYVEQYISMDNTRWGLKSGETNDDIYFTDTYAKTFPTEDRARLMEYLLVGEDIDYYSGKHLQQKLIYYSRCIRAGFDTKGWPETTFWEMAINS